jgi:hypothetical protein
MKFLLGDIFKALLLNDEDNGLLLHVPHTILHLHFLLLSTIWMGVVDLALRRFTLDKGHSIRNGLLFLFSKFGGMCPLCGPSLPCSLFGLKVGALGLRFCCPDPPCSLLPRHLSCYVPVDSCNCCYSRNCSVVTHVSHITLLLIPLSSWLILILSVRMLSLRLGRHLVLVVKVAPFHDFYAFHQA